MAAPPPATSFKTSAEAFKYPLPNVRQFHKQLQTALDEKNARLRTLVGGSYRQLLGTAEMIVDMRRDVGSVEVRLARVAEGCGRSVVGRKVAGLGKLGGGIGAGREELGWVARLKVLDGCGVVVGRVLRGKESSGLSGTEQSGGRRLVVAAKVLVLARLLVKSLGEEATGVENSIEGGEELLQEMKRKLGGLRRRLLREIERMLGIVDGDREDLAQALCAYSLATSSGARDVLRHFLHVRGEAMALAFEEEGDAPRTKMGKGESILRALGLYTRTLLDAQALVPRHLSDALLALKSKPLLQDDNIQALEGLRLDVSERWFGDEILYFTPYIRHDELDGSQAAEMLKGWSRKASEVLLHGFETTLARISEFKTVVDLRTQIFASWIRDGGKARGFDSSILLDGLRQVVNERLLALLEARVAKLHLIGTEVEGVLGAWEATIFASTKGLWNDEVLTMEVTGGATDFKRTIISSLHGRTDSVSRVVKGYETWCHLIDELTSTIAHLRTQRWNDDLESLEDDDILEHRSALFSKDDPHMLKEHLDTALTSAFKSLHQKLAALIAAYEESDHIGPIAVFLLRILRDVRAALPKEPNLSFFGLALIPGLHLTLVTSVAASPLSALNVAITRRTKVVGRALWEGAPELPVHPSPAVFRFLHALMEGMGTAGADLWSGDAVVAVRRFVGAEVGRLWMGNLEKEEHGVEKSESATGDEEVVDKDKVEEEAEALAVRRRDILIQSLFDVYLLQQCLLPVNTADKEKSEEGSGLLVLEETILVRAALAEKESERVRSGAKEYWKRTGLLFGLLT